MFGLVVTYFERLALLGSNVPVGSVISFEIVFFIDRNKELLSSLCRFYSVKRLKAAHKHQKMDIGHNVTK